MNAAACDADPATIAPEAVKAVILASAPERKGDLESIWKKYAPVFSLANDKPGFHFEAGAFGMILFTSRSMTYMWLLGFAAQQALKDYAGVCIGSVLNNKFDPEYFDYSHVSRYGQLISSIREVAEVENEADFEWPGNVPHPRFGKPKEESGAMVFDLLCMAAAYSFLHEVEHIRIVQEGVKLEPHVEEMRCDEFAREVLLGNISSYSAMSGFPPEAVATKRSISIALASFFLLVITPPQAWGGSRTHPPIANRIRALTDSVNLPDNDHFWVYLSSILLAHLHFNGDGFESFAVASMREFSLHLLSRFPDG